MTFTNAGVVTFLFTDLVGSTALIDRLGDDAADEVRRGHFDVLRKAIEKAGGEEVKNLGDGLMVSFASPVAALSCAVAMQRALAESEHRIRVGVHAGEPVHEGADYFGTPVVVAKRLCDRAEGGQILATELLAGLVGTRGGFQFVPRGRLSLKGLSEPVSTVEVRWQADEAAGPVAASGRRRGARPARSRGPGIVGRERELAVLDEELAAATAGELRCVLLSAEAGVGKSRLVREFLARHDEVTPLTARAHPMGDTTAFGLWAEALDGHLRHLPAPDVTRCCGGFVEDLAAILRSVAAVRGSLPESPPPRSALLEGITVVLDNLAADAPVVVLLDDIHQADASSLDALSYLATNLADAAVLVVLAARPAELSEHPLANRVLLPLEQDGFLIRLPLAPLDEEELRTLAASVLKEAPPPALVQWLQSRSRGNPLFALGLVRALLDEGADLAAPRLRRVPEDLADRVRALLATLDTRALTVMELLTVIGRPASIDELGSLSTKSHEEISISLDELIRHRTVSEEERSGEPAFAVAHPLIQETIYDSIGTPRRRLLHRQIGRALFAAGRPAEAAPHFTRSASRGDGEAIEALRQALREAEDRRAYREAVSMLGGLVDILPEGDERWLEIGQVLSGEAEWAQYPNPSRTEAELAIRALRAMDPVLAGSGEVHRRGLLQLRLCHLLCWGVGDPAGAVEAADEAVRLFQAAGDEVKVLQARHERAWARGHTGDVHALAVESGAVAVEAARLGDEFLEMLALSGEANGLGFDGRVVEAEERIRRAIEIGARRSRRPSTQWRAVLAYWMAFQGKTAEALQELEAARADDPGFADTALLEIGTVVLGLAGDVQRALAWTEETFAWNPGLLATQKCLGLPFAALMAAEAGDPALARRYAETAQAACVGDWRQVTAGAEAVLGWLDVMDDGSEAAFVRFERAVHRLMTGASAYASLFVLDLCEFAALVGDVARAERAEALLAELAAVTGCTLHAGIRTLSSAWTALAQGSPEAAVLARQAIGILDELDFPLLQGRGYDLLGRALAAHDAEEAAKALRQAVGRFETCGAVWRRDRALAEIERLDR